MALVGVLESEQQADAHGAIRGCLHRGVGEAGEFGNEAGVVDERIDVVELDVIEDVLGVEVHLEVDALPELDALDDGHIHVVGSGSAERIARSVAKGRAEDLVGLESVGDVAHGVFGGRSTQSVSLVDGIEADKLRGSQAAAGADESRARGWAGAEIVASVGRIDANLGCGCRHAADEWTRAAVEVSGEAGVEAGINIG